MPTDLPYAAEAETSLSYDEIEVLRTQYYKEIEQGHVTTQSKFNYGWGLIKSTSAELQTEGVKLLQEIYSASPAHRRECTYYIAVGYYKLSNYAYAKKFNDLLLSVEPDNMQAQSLRTLIDQAVTRDGYIGMGIIAGGAAVTGIILAKLLARPDSVDPDGQPRIVVMKDGCVTDLTVGSYSGLEAYTATALGIESKELAIYDLDRSSGPFSGKEDSGSLVFDGQGWMLGRPAHRTRVGGGR